MSNGFLTYFNIHRRFRNGVFSLFIGISVLCTANFLLEPKENAISDDLVVLEVYEDALSILKKEQVARNEQYRQKQFNPNFISDYKGYVLGISPKALDKIHSFRAGGKWINSSQEFQEVSGVSDSLLKELAPLFKFPQIKTAKSNKSDTPSGSKSWAQKSDLNLVTASVLQEVVGLPDFIAQRVVDYRNSLGGFVDDIQLEDVYGLYPKQRKKVLSLYTVKEKGIGKLLDINTASVQELMTVPYFDFEMALALRDFIKENGKIKSFDELDQIEDFPIGKVARIALYVKI